MPRTTGFNKKMAELVYGVHEGDTIRITQMDDPYIPQGSYNGKEGVVELIDSAGQLHGTWGGLAVIPGEDKFIVIKHEEVPGKLYLFACRYTDSNGDKIRTEVCAGTTKRATEIAKEGFARTATDLTVNLVREATREEYEEVENTGAPSPKSRR